MIFSISRRKEFGRIRQERWPSKFDSNWGKHCCCCWFVKKWRSNRIKNDSRIFEHPQDCSFFGFWMRIWEKASCVHVLFQTPWLLSKGKNESHLAKTLSRRPMQTKFFNNIIMGDENWYFASDPETKWQNTEWVGETSPRPTKMKFQRSRIKIMLIIFFDSLVVMHKEFVPEGKTVNAKFYKKNNGAPSTGSSSCVLLSRFFSCYMKMC
jgi:hypothetical protein